MPCWDQCAERWKHRRRVNFRQEIPGRKKDVKETFRDACGTKVISCYFPLDLLFSRKRLAGIFDVIEWNEMFITWALGEMATLP